MGAPTRRSSPRSTRPPPTLWHRRWTSTTTTCCADALISTEPRGPRDTAWGPRVAPSAGAPLRGEEIRQSRHITRVRDLLVEAAVALRDRQVAPKQQAIVI